MGQSVQTLREIRKVYKRLYVLIVQHRSSFKQKKESKIDFFFLPTMQFKRVFDAQMNRLHWRSYVRA